MTPWQWLRFACGIWTEGEEPWLEPGSWDALADRDVEIDVDQPVWLGVDVGVRNDSTAIVVAGRSVDGRLVVRARVISPPSHGVVELARVERAVRETCADYRVEGVAYDPWSFRRSAEILEADGLPMVEFPQSPERMANASENLRRAIESGELVHDGDPVLRAHVMAGVTKDTERGWRLVKDPKLRRPIDALIALAMAAMVANAEETVPMVAWR
jgi:phage terminase large subunit-like protein